MLLDVSALRVDFIKKIIIVKTSKSTDYNKQLQIKLCNKEKCDTYRKISVKPPGYYFQRLIFEVLKEVLIKRGPIREGLNWGGGLLKWGLIERGFSSKI